MEFEQGTFEKVLDAITTILGLSPTNQIKFYCLLFIVLVSPFIRVSRSIQSLVNIVLGHLSVSSRVWTTSASSAKASSATRAMFLSSDTCFRHPSGEIQEVESNEGLRNEYQTL